MRLITRDDFDGLICAVFLKQLEPVTDIELAHASDIHSGRVEIRAGDIIANLPYGAGCSLWFDHHSSEAIETFPTGCEGRFALAPSCARAIYDYYGAPASLDRFRDVLADADKIDAAELSREDVLNPGGWVLIANTLQRFPVEKIGLPLEEYFLQLIDWIGRFSPEEILQIPEVAERVAASNAEQAEFREALEQCSYVHENVIISDMRMLDRPAYGNRFLVYTLFPEQNISIKIVERKSRGVVSFACGHSIFRRDSRTNVGSLMKSYGGGGHRGAGTCRVAPEEAEQTLAELLEKMTEDG